MPLERGRLLRSPATTFWTSYANNGVNPEAIQSLELTVTPESSSLALACTGIGMGVVAVVRNRDVPGLSLIVLIAGSRSLAQFNRESRVPCILPNSARPKICEDRVQSFSSPLTSECSFCRRRSKTR